MSKKKHKVLVVATSRKTRGGITSVVKAHETGEQWKKYHCKWIQTHRDGNCVRKLWYLGTALIQYLVLLPFYDIVHIHVALGKSVNRKCVFANLAKVLRKKIIIHFHPATEKFLFDEKYSIPAYKLFCKADLIVVLSNQWMVWINKAFPNNNFRYEVLYNPCPCVTRDQSKRQKKILYAGILSDRKGYNRLLKAFAKIANNYKDWKLVFAGNGEIEKGKELANELSISGQVEFLGWVSGEEKCKIFQEASIYCLPSWGEGFPMGVLDAIAYGIPVITTPVGGIPDIIKDKVNGLIYNVYDIDALSNCLEYLMKSPNNRRIIVQKADELLKNDFNLSLIHKKLEYIYKTI